MTQKLEIELVENSIEREALLLLDEKGKCMMGEIFMSLKISYNQGYRVLNSLLKKNLITKEGTHYTLTVQIAK